jgi:hypothetical protein
MRAYWGHGWWCRLSRHLSSSVRRSLANETRGKDTSNVPPWDSYCVLQETILRHFSTQRLCSDRWVDLPKVRANYFAFNVRLHTFSTGTDCRLRPFPKIVWTQPVRINKWRECEQTMMSSWCRNLRDSLLIPFIRCPIIVAYFNDQQDLSTVGIRSICTYVICYSCGVSNYQVAYQY